METLVWIMRTEVKMAPFRIMRISTSMKIFLSKMK